MTDWDDLRAKVERDLETAAEAGRDLVNAAMRSGEAVMWLQRLADWGWGENAPDNAIQDWKEARAWLEANT